MKSTTFYIAGNSPAIRCAAEYLKGNGVSIVSEPQPEVTHVLLPVPAFDDNCRFQGGDLGDTLKALPQDVTIFGGKLNTAVLDGYRCVDLLQDEAYLAENAAITADCAIRIAGNHLGVVFRGCPVLVIGWGRIGKCLAKLLKAMEAEVTVAARKERDRAMAHALGFEVTDIGQLAPVLSRFRVIFNSAPASVLSGGQMQHCRNDSIKIDLASKSGIPGSDVLWARGLPGKNAPESSGLLIGKTVLGFLNKEASL